MKRFFRAPLVVFAIVPFLFAVAGAQSDAPKAASKAADRADKADRADAKPAKQRAKARGRLPAFYGQVVDGLQREKIYAIQKDYEPKISALQAELKALQDKRDADCQAVLTPEQREKLKALTDAAKQKRKGAATASATASATAETQASGGEKAASAKPASDAKSSK